MAGLEEAIDVVGVGHPGLLRTGEVVDEAAVEAGAIALVVVVVDAAALPVDVLEVSSRALAVEILPDDEDGGPLPRCLIGYNIQFNSRHKSGGRAGRPARELP